MASITYRSPSLADKVSTIGFGNRATYPQSTDSYLGSLFERMSNAFGRCLSLFEGVGMLDKTLKLADAGFKVTRHVSPEAYAPAAPAHKGISETRGWFSLFKVPGGLWRVVSGVTNLSQLLTKTAGEKAPLSMDAKGWSVQDPSKAKYFQKITDAALQRLAIVHQFLSVIGDSLYTAAFTSKSFMFIDSKYKVMKEKLYNFSQSFPKIFFGLHIVKMIKTPLAMRIEHVTYNREVKSKVVLGDDAAKNLEVCQKRRNLEIGHVRNQASHVIEIVKTCFEFVSDGAYLSKTTNPVIGLVGTVGNAVFDFIGAWFKTATV